MIGMVHSEWWVIVARGIVAIAFGVLALAWPFEAATAIAILIALFILLDGVFSLASAVKGRSRSWGLGVFEGLLGILIGVLALVVPDVTAMVLAVLIGIWALVTGIIELVMAFRFRGELGSEWLLSLAGALSVILGIAIIASPGAGVVVLAVIVGVYALLFGVSLVVFGLQMRRGRPS